jgi:hypothetical protein
MHFCFPLIISHFFHLQFLIFIIYIVSGFSLLFQGFLHFQPYWISIRFVIFFPTGKSLVF